MKLTKIGTCTTCSKEFTTSHRASNSLYCEECRKEARKKSDKEYRERKRARTPPSENPTGRPRTKRVRKKTLKVYHRICSTCSTEFDTTHSTAKNCEEHRYKKSAKEKSYNRKYMLKKMYGITEEDYEKMFEAQDGKCAVCLKPESSFKRKLSVDHNHETGEIRGLLCTHCNHRIVGRHKDAQLFYRAAKHLDNHTGFFVPETNIANKYRKPKGRVKLLDQKEDYNSGLKYIEEVENIIIDET